MTPKTPTNRLCAGPAALPIRRAIRTARAAMMTGQRCTVATTISTEIKFRISLLGRAFCAPYFFCSSTVEEHGFQPCVRPRGYAKCGIAVALAAGGIGNATIFNNASQQDAHKLQLRGAVRGVGGAGIEACNGWRRGFLFGADFSQSISEFVGDALQPLSAGFGQHQHKTVWPVAADAVDAAHLYLERLRDLAQNSIPMLKAHAGIELGKILKFNHQQRKLFMVALAAGDFFGGKNVKITLVVEYGKRIGMSDAPQLFGKLHAANGGSANIGGSLRDGAVVGGKEMRRRVPNHQRSEGFSKRNQGNAQLRAGPGEAKRPLGAVSDIVDYHVHARGKGFSQNAGAFGGNKTLWLWFFFSSMCAQYEPAFTVAQQDADFSIVKSIFNQICEIFQKLLQIVGGGGRAGDEVNELDLPHAAAFGGI